MAFFITIDQAYGVGYCEHCNYAGRLKKEAKPCNYHAHKALMAYRKVPGGMCGLYPKDRKRKSKDFSIGGSNGI